MSQQINLYHPIFRRQEKKFSAIAMVQAGAAIIAGIAVLYAILFWQHNEQRNELEQIDQQRLLLSNRLDDMTKKYGQREKSQLLEREVQRLEKQLGAMTRVQEILRRGVFTNTSGYSNFFIAFARQHISGMWLTGFDISGAGEKMRIAGRSTNPALVPRYVQKLASEKPLAGAEFEIFQMSRPEDARLRKPAHYVEFQIVSTGGKEAETR